MANNPSVRKLLFILFLAFVHANLHAVTVTATVTPTACTPCNGSITATGASGAVPYQYSIDGGVTWQSSGTFTGLCAATYTVTVRDAGLATATTTATVVQNPTLTWSASGVNCTAYNLCNGQINVTISGGIPPYTIRVQSSSGTSYYSSSPITNLCPGTYTVTVIDASNNCGLGYTGPVVITIGVGPPHGPGNLYCTTGYAVGQCQFVCDNTLTASGSGGTPPYMYSLNGGPFTSSGTFSGLCEGPNTYTVCVRDAAMNTWCVQAYYPTNFPYTRMPPVVTASGCPCSGSIVFSPAGMPGEQFWLVQNNVTIATNTTGSFTGLCPGQYTVSSMYQGCGLVFPVQVVPGTPTFSVTLTTTNPTCYNSCDASITCTPSPWSATGYQYSKDNGVTWQSSNTFTNLCAATYNILVKDSANCYGSYSQTITNPAQLALTLTTSQPNCANGNCLGGIICSPATGPTAPYQWSKDGGVTWQSSNQFLNLCVGTVTVTVRDANGCTRNSSAILSSTLNQYYLGRTITQPTCANPCGGVINLTLGSSNAPAAYNLYSIDSGVTWQSGLSFSGLCAGTYYAQAKNTLTGCYSPFLTIVVNPPTMMALSATSAQPSCPSSCNGTMQATVTAGTNPPYQYSKDGGVTWQSSSLFTGMCAGTYTITVKNALNCTATQTVVVNSTPAVTASATSTDPVCNGDCNGTLTASASSTPTLTYQYSINGGVNWYTSGLFNGLCAGSVTVQVKDSYNCITSTSVTLTNPPPVIASLTATPPLCSDVCNGTILLNPTQPAGYTYSIDSGLTWQSTTNYSGLCAGPYTVMIHDGAGCSSDSTFTFIAPPPISASTSVTSISCVNRCDGAIALSATPAGTYTYSLDSGLTWQASNAFANLCAGQYDFMVRDSNMCSAYGTETLIAPLPVVAMSSQVNPLCYNDCNGSITIGVTPAGTYQFSADLGLTWQSGNAFSGLCAGNYTIIVENPSGCADTVTSSLLMPDSIVLQSALTHILCYGDSTGTIQLNSNVSNAQYSIDGGATWTTDSSFFNLVAGTYSAEVMNGNGCTDSMAVTITSPPALSVSTACTFPSYCGCSGQMTPYGLGGVPNYTYTITPVNQQMGLCVGTYTVTTTDANGCTASAPFTIFQALPIQIDSISSTPAVAPNNDGTATVYFHGGANPYGVQWDAAAGWQPFTQATNLAPGTYCVTVYDSYGCTDTACVTVGVITSVAQTPEVKWDIYPNPANTSFTVTGANAVMQVVLYDLQGRMIVNYGGTILSESGTMFTLPQDIATGNYVVELVNGDTVVRKKLTVER